MSNNSSVNIQIAVEDQYSKGLEDAAKKAKELDRTMATFGTQSNDVFNQKIERLIGNYDKLAKSGRYSAEELSRAHAYMSVQIDDLQKKMQFKAPDVKDMELNRFGIRSEGVINAEIKSIEDGYKRLATAGILSADELARAQESALSKIKQLRSEMQAPIKVSPVQVDMSKLGMRSHADIAKEIKDLEAGYKRLGQSGLLTTTELSQAKLKLINQTSELRKQTSGWVDSLMAAKESMAGLATSLAVIGKSVNKAIDFETSLVNIDKVASFTDSDALAKFGKELQNLSREIPLTVTELAAMAEAAGQMGIATQDLQSFVTVAAKMSTAFKMTGDESGAAIGKLMTIFTMSVPQVEKLGDAINVLGNTTNAKEKDIIEVLTRIGGIGQQFGLSAKELSALAASFLSLGKTSETAGTAINALLSKLSTANVQTKDFKDALGTLGISAKQLADDISADPTKALDAFLTKLSSLPKQIQGDTIGRLFGAEFSDDVAALVQTLDAYRKNLAGVIDENNTAGAMQSEFAKRLATTRSQLDLMLNALNEIAINAGTAFLPLVEAIAKLTTSIAQLVADITSSSTAVYAISAGLLLLASRMEIVQKLAAVIGLLFANIGSAKAVQGISGIAGALGSIVVEGGKASKTIDGIQGALSKLSFANLANGAALFFGSMYAGGAAMELAFKSATDKIQQTENTLNSLTQAQQQWNALQQQAQTAGMSNAQLDQIRQIKIETLNTQAVLTQNAQFNSQLNQQAMQEVQNQVSERLRLNELLKSKLVEKSNAEAALEKLTQEKIKQERTEAYNEAKRLQEKFISDKQQALQAEQDKEKAAIDKIKDLRKQLADTLASDADRLREIQRRDMTDAEKQADIAKQAAEKMAQAQQALSAGDTTGAAKLADDAKTLSERIDDSNAAMASFKQASDLSVQINQMQQYQAKMEAAQARTNQQKISVDISDAEQQLQLLNDTIAQATQDPKEVEVQAQIDQAQSAIESIQAQLDSLQDKTVTVTVVEKTVQARRWGGFITDNTGDIPRFKTGGKLPGYGGGDRIHALLEAGEFIVRKEAVAKYGAGAMHAINNLRLPKFQNGGMVGDLGRTGTGSMDTVKIELNLGNSRIVPFTTKREEVQAITDAFAFIARGGFS